PLFFCLRRPAPSSPLFPYTTLFRSLGDELGGDLGGLVGVEGGGAQHEHHLPAQNTPAGIELVDGHLDAAAIRLRVRGEAAGGGEDRKSTRLNSSHVKISYAVFCLKK